MRGLKHNGSIPTEKKYIILCLMCVICKKVSKDTFTSVGVEVLMYALRNETWAFLDGRSFLI